MHMEILQKAKGNAKIGCYENFDLRKLRLKTKDPSQFSKLQKLRPSKIKSVEI